MVQARVDEYFRLPGGITGGDLKAKIYSILEGEDSGGIALNGSLTIKQVRRKLAKKLELDNFDPMEDISKQMIEDCVLDFCDENPDFSVKDEIPEDGIGPAVSGGKVVSKARLREAVKRVFAILRDGNMQELTMKKIRKQLEEELGADLSDENSRKVIDQAVQAFLLKEEAEQKRKVEEEGSDSSLPNFVASGRISSSSVNNFNLEARLTGATVIVNKDCFAVPGLHFLVLDIDFDISKIQTKHFTKTVMSGPVTQVLPSGGFTARVHAADGPKGPKINQLAGDWEAHMEWKNRRWHLRGLKALPEMTITEKQLQEQQQQTAIFKSRDNVEEAKKAMKRAKRSVAAGDLISAVIDYSKALILGSQPELLLNRAECFADMECYEHAINDCYTYFEVQPVSSVVGRPKKWVGEYLKRSAKVLMTRAQAYERLDLLGEAYKDYFGCVDILENFQGMQTDQIKEDARRALNHLKLKGESNRRTLYELKITLASSDPPIYRIVSVEAESTLGELHHVIVKAMGWQGGHMHRFLSEGLIFATSDPSNEDLDGDDPLDHDYPEETTPLKFVLRRVSEAMIHEYDFGDGWRHEIVLESIKEKDHRHYPLCTGGARACPPEDVGGMAGYKDFLQCVIHGDFSAVNFLSKREALHWAKKQIGPTNVAVRLNKNPGLKGNPGDWDPEGFALGPINGQLRNFHSDDEATDDEL